MNIESTAPPARRTASKQAIAQLKTAPERINLRREALQIRVGFGKTQLYKQIKAGIFPRGISITASGHTKVWPVDEVERVMRARAAGWAVDQQKRLVEEIHAARMSAEV